MNDRLAELHERIGRRQRRRRAAVGGTAALVLVVAGLSVARLGGDEEGSVATVSTSSTSTTTTSTTPSASVTRLRLPDEGVALELERGVVLLSLDGSELGELPGFRISGFSPSVPGPVLLEEGTDRHFHLLDQSRILPRPIVDEEIVLPMPHGNHLAANALRDPGGSEIRRDGRQVFELGSTMTGNPAVAHDRDLVSRESFDDNTNRAYDLRTGKIDELPRGCEVADRHGERRYLLCEGTVRAGDAGDPSPSVLFGPRRGVGRWVKAMVSPDGKDVLLEWWAECEVPLVFTGSSTGGALRSLFEEKQATALGWTEDGRTVVMGMSSECGAGVRPGLYVDEELVYAIPPGTSVRAAAMWAPNVG